MSYNFTTLKHYAAAAVSSIVRISAVMMMKVLAVVVGECRSCGGDALDEIRLYPHC